MVESTIALAKEVIEKSKEVKDVMPSFFDKMKTTDKSGKIDIFEPVADKNNFKVSDYQKELVKEKYGVDFENITKIGNWEDFEKSLLSDDIDVDVDDLLSDEEDELISEVDAMERYKHIPLDGNGGEWDGFRGDSLWRPFKDSIPKIGNPENLTWREILKKYGIEGIEYKDGEPDFTPVSKGNVEIDNFTEKRIGKGNNFDQATKKLAEQRGCTEREVKDWMKENKYTWHECSDCKTMQKVPTIIHGNIRHAGGISEMKSKSNGKES